MVSTSLSAITPITRMRRPWLLTCFRFWARTRAAAGLWAPVQQDPGVLGDHLQAARPAGRLQPLPDGGLGHGKTSLAEQFHHRQGYRGIAVLVPAPLG